MERKAAAQRHGRPLGQHFLTRPEIAAWVADAAGLTGTETVLEIGPGRGILTRELLMRAKHVISVEKDPSLIKELTRAFEAEIATEQLTLIKDDVRNLDPTMISGPYAVVANVPYYITGRIIRQFLTAEHQPTAMTLLVQKEVAERIVAKDGKESLLSLSVKAYGEPHYVRTVKAGSFSPPPKVDSAILHIARISRHNFTGTEHETRFFSLLHAAFRNKRKQLKSTFAERTTQVLDDRTAHSRAEEMPIHFWLHAAAVD